MARGTRAIAKPGPADGDGDVGRRWLYDLGCDISEWVSNVAAHPFVQFGFVIFCVAWFTLGLDTNLLTAALSILAITLTQMVLNRQNEREAEAHRRDVAMHAKLDELIIAVRHAHNEMAGIEDLPEEVIVEMKEQALELAEAAEEKPQREKGRGASRR
ncbi:MAG: low affinity iron permease family protein [Sphingomicrobium sp.]